eukprot:10007638-Heterocapsa_arctica.AAC.1
MFGVMPYCASTAATYSFQLPPVSRKCTSPRTSAGSAVVGRGACSALSRGWGSRCVRSRVCP